MRTSRADCSAQPREVIRQLLKGHDSSITAFECVNDPLPDSAGIYRYGVLLYLIGPETPPERVQVLMNLEAQQVHFQKPHERNVSDG
jgi:hypothetical protein